ncbi:glycosyltransferase family 39 protein [Streptomyces diastatochromogenes]|nr:glycosyltransferase family 39 protein [Streptomyces diastatochromogenes]
MPAGLLAAAFLALTPVTVGLGRSVTEDAPFVLLLLLAAEATWRATAHARPRTLLLAAAWVGLAFQCKMLEAWAVLPALTVTYAVAAPTRRAAASAISPWPRRSRSRCRCRGCWWPRSPRPGPARTSTAPPTTRRSGWSSATTS